jgi:hypothetical protein
MVADCKVFNVNTKIVRLGDVFISLPHVPWNMIIYGTTEQCEVCALAMKTRWVVASGLQSNASDVVGPGLEPGSREQLTYYTILRDLAKLFKALLLPSPGATLTPPKLIH